MPKTTGSTRHVIVKHISDQDVEHHIKVLGVKSRRKTQGSCNNLVNELLNDGLPITRKKGTAGQKVDNNENDVKDTLLLDEVLSKKHLNKLSQDDENVSSLPMTDLYNFKTPKKSKQMTKFAMESAKKMRNSQKENQLGLPTPKTPQITPSNDTTKTPSNMEETPMRKSKRLQSAQKYGVQEVLARQHDDDVSDDSAESDDEESQDSKSKHRAYAYGGLGKPSASELYFEAHKAGGKLSATTSDRTMSRMKTPQISFDQMQTILERIEKTKFDAVKKVKGQKITSDHVKIEASRMQMISRYRTYFQKWMFHISHGFNLILFGFGSKRKLLHEFCQKMLPDFDKVIINGYFPSLLFKSVLNSICDVIDDVTITNSSQQNQLDAICEAYSSDHSSHLFLIIHNIDGANLRNSKAQDMLCRLSQCKRIHIIATIDHINATLIWDQSTLVKFNWLWYDVTTFEWYKDETSYENSLSLLTSGGGVGGSLALTGLSHVLRSLTPNARGIFKLIVERQIEEGNAELSYNGLSFSDLYQMCREKFLVNSELTLRSQLTEFLDHKLIHTKKGLDGVENLTIPLDTATLKEFLDQGE